MERRDERDAHTTGASARHADRKSPVTRALEALSDDDGSSGALIPIVYEELRNLARASFAQLDPGQTLQATALVHEAWLKVAGGDATRWRDRRHFFRAAAQAMRQLLVDQARRKASVKHGGEHKRAEARPDEPAVGPPVEDVLGVDEALEKLEGRHPRRHEVVMLRFFAGMQETEIAELLEISRTTVQEDWRFARAWLMSELGDGESSPEASR